MSLRPAPNPLPIFPSIRLAVNAVRVKSKSVGRSLGMDFNIDARMESHGIFKYER